MLVDNVSKYGRVMQEVINDMMDAVLSAFQGWFNFGPPKGLTGRVGTAKDRSQARLKTELQADVEQALADYIRLRYSWVTANFLVISHGLIQAQQRPILGFAFEVFTDGSFVFVVKVYSSRGIATHPLEPGVKPFVSQALSEVVPHAALRPEPSLQETIEKLNLRH